MQLPHIEQKADDHISARPAYLCVTTLFFAWGLITSLVDPLVAAVKGVFSLSDVQAQLSASAFFLAYGLVSLPAAALVGRLRATDAVLVALAAMACGCLLMLAAANLANYSIVLAGLFVLAGGITILQVAANPLAASLGPPARTHFRLTFAQSLNSLGTFIGPYLGATLFLRGLEATGANTAASRSAALAGIDQAFFWLCALIVVLGAFLFSRRKLVDGAARALLAPQAKQEDGPARGALKSRWAVLGAGAIFLYVGAEVAIGTQLALFLNSSSGFGVTLESAGKFVSLYWGGALLGRLVGSALLARFSAPRLLAIAAALACLSCLCVAIVGGVAGGVIAIGIGLFNSIMFPVIFSVTLERSSASAAATSGLLCFAIVGGAVIPPLAGLVAQTSGYPLSFGVPAACYLLLLGFALAAARASVMTR